MMEKSTKDRIEKTRGHTYRQCAFTLLANMTLFSYGLDVGWISPMFKILQSDKSPLGEPLSDTMLSWTASSLCLAAVFSVQMYSYIADRFGSRISVIAIAVPQAISWIIRLWLASGPALVISRIFSGIATGGCFNVVLIYIKEISQDSIRGILSSTLVLLQTTGIFTMYVMGAYLEYYTILWIVSVVSILAGILLCRAPDSPSFLIKHGKVDEALATLAYLRGLEKDDEIVVNEITLIRNENDNFKSLPTMSLKTIVKNPIWRRGIIISTVLVSVQALNGAFAITTYASLILSSTGANFSISIETLSFTIPAVLIFGSIVSTSCSEKMGRKVLNIIMLSITTCSMLGIAVSTLIATYGGTVPSWVPILCMMTSVWAYSGGVSPVPFVIMAEMFSFQIRPKVFGIIVTINWFMTFLPIVGYMPLSNAIGIHYTFFIFTGVNVFGILFSWFFLPETRGKSVSEIEADIAKRLGLDNMETNTTKSFLSPEK